jgi:CRP-like cAMP-binding protein
MGTLESILAEHPTFKDLDDKNLRLIVGCASNVRFEEGAYIFREGDEANQFFLIRHGQVALEIFRQRRGPIVIETVGEGDVLGWSWLFPPYRWNFDARALQLTRAIAMDGRCIRTKCEEDPRLGYELVKRFARILMERLSATRMQLLDVYGDQE